MTGQKLNYCTSCARSPARSRVCGGKHDRQNSGPRQITRYTLTSGRSVPSATTPGLNVQRVKCVRLVLHQLHGLCSRRSSHVPSRPSPRDGSAGGPWCAGISARPMSEGFPYDSGSTRPQLRVADGVMMRGSQQDRRRTCWALSNLSSNTATCYMGP
eukprot:753962-Hanusia_phi.AAC.1